LVKKKVASSIDVLSHFLVPKMEIIDDSEKKKVLKKFSIVENQLPKILVTDPSIQALKANAGDIVSINREDLTGKYTVYKLVV